MTPENVTPCAICESAAKVIEHINGIDTGLCAKAIRAACSHAPPRAEIAELIAEARKQAEQLAREGINGTPNLLVQMADALSARASEGEDAERIISLAYFHGFTKSGDLAAFIAHPERLEAIDRNSVARSHRKEGSG